MIHQKVGAALCFMLLLMYLLFPQGVSAETPKGTTTVSQTEQKCTPEPKVDPKPMEPLKDPCATKPCMQPAGPSKPPKAKPKEPPHSQGPWDEMKNVLKHENNVVEETNRNYDKLNVRPGFRLAPGWAQPPPAKQVHKGGPPKKKTH